MIVFNIDIADVVVQVHAIYDSSREYCKEYLSEQKPDFSVVITHEDLLLEREKAAKTDVAEGKSVRNVSDAQLEITAIQRKIAREMFSYDTILFHGSVVAVDGQAYLFTAKSGTGKSTHTRLWREVFGNRAIMVNDDKPFLRIENQKILACGSPWNGKHRLGTDIKVPLKAICILERGQENSIVKIEPQDGLHMLLQQSNRPNGVKMLGTFLEMIDTIAKCVPLFRMCCNMDPKAAVMAYHAMAERNEH
jgi:hypothetical protein